MKNRELVEKIARDVRKKMLILADNEYDDLCGYCAIASGELHRRLTNAGIDCTIRMCKDRTLVHVYVVVDDHVVDITATQYHYFREQPVVIMHEREAAIYDFYNSKYEFDSVADLQRMQLKQNWPDEQLVVL